MDEEDIQELIAGGQQADVDWLPGRAPVEDIAPILTAMANCDGGTLLLGIAPRTDRIAGVEDVDAAIDRVLRATLAVSPPLIIPLPSKVTVGQFTLLAVEVPRGLPHVYAYDGRFYARQGTLNQPMDARSLRQMLVERGDVSFEEAAAHGATKDDLAWEQVETYVAGLRGLSGQSATDVLLKRGCLIKEGEEVVPTNAGILLFGKDPQRFVRGSEITAARFAGIEMGDTFTRQDIVGTLPDQLRRIETFLADNLRKEVKIGQTMAREEQFEYPMEAAREVVVNAVSHRNYGIQGDGIRLYIFSDHMEVTSPGGLPGPVTVENIVNERFSRNPIIVQVLADMGFIERLGYGVDRVMALMKSHGLSAPLFEETSGGVKVTMHNHRASETTGEPSAFGGMFRGNEVNPRQESALDFLIHRQNPRITNKDLQELCPDVHSETLRRDLADLVNKGILIKMGQKRGSYYVLKR
ncbi:MAG: putative DNA binding domain-containing protein [Anaerolineae bacterium]|nr:putative DNA binding domain-containing protein [Anaerolineae bacterium]